MCGVAQVGKRRDSRHTTHIRQLIRHTVRRHTVISHTVPRHSRHCLSMYMSLGHTRLVAQIRDVLPRCRHGVSPMGYILAANIGVQVTLAMNLTGTTSFLMTKTNESKVR